MALFPPTTLVAGPIAVGTGLASWGLQGVSAGLACWGYGWDSKEFHSALGLFVLGGSFIGKSKMTRSMLRRAGIDERVIGEKIVDIGYDVTTTVIGIFTW
ncbi:hypothetical protein AB0D14_43745 [Streptomyces sp. NPDC048484]|uniref:hypothetical protein n=1 Tax=Streptomyces sp. NPDC048484 TaxID=3155146 RepID=UPI0034272C4D